MANGAKKPEPRSKRISITLRPDAHAKIERAADAVGLSVNAWIAYTLGSAANAQMVMLDKMGDSLADAVMKAAQDENDS